MRVVKYTPFLRNLSMINVKIDGDMLREIVNYTKCLKKIFLRCPGLESAEALKGK